MDLLSNFPYKRKYYEILGYVYETLNEFHKSLKLRIQAASFGTKTSFSAWKSLLADCEKHGETRLAEICCFRLSRLQPTNWEVTKRRLELLYETNQFGKLVLCYCDILKLEKNAAVLRAGLDLCLNDRQRLVVENIPFDVIQRLFVERNVVGKKMFGEENAKFEAEKVGVGEKMGNISLLDETNTVSAKFNTGVDQNSENIAENDDNIIKKKQKIDDFEEYNSLEIISDFEDNETINAQIDLFDPKNDKTDLNESERFYSENINFDPIQTDQIYQKIYDLDENLFKSSKTPNFSALSIKKIPTSLEKIKNADIAILDDAINAENDVKNTENVEKNAEDDEIIDLIAIRQNNNKNKAIKLLEHYFSTNGGNDRRRFEMDEDEIGFIALLCDLYVQSKKFRDVIELIEAVPGPEKKFLPQEVWVCRAIALIHLGRFESVACALEKCCLLEVFLNIF